MVGERRTIIGNKKQNKKGIHNGNAGPLTPFSVGLAKIASCDFDEKQTEKKERKMSTTHSTNQCGALCMILLGDDAHHATVGKGEKK